MKRRFRIDVRMLALFLTQLCWVGAAAAQIPIPPSTQFDVTGFLQEATVATPGAPLSGGSLTVNGQVVTVPASTVVILPANALTWQELFAQAPATYKGLGLSGLALADFPAPLASYEVHVIGNRVLGPPDRYIAGLIYISQQGLNSGAGFINFIDYALGEMRVGGPIGVESGTRVRINDPIPAGGTTGRFSMGNSPDPRFTVDQDNPTIISATGFPMCLPRGSATGDPLCPDGNRPVDVAGNPITAINMPDPATLAPGQLPDPRLQVPFKVGDYITYAGTLVVDNTTPTVGPYPTPNLTPTTYVSAHTIVNNVGIWTFPGTNPAYVMTEVTIIGTGGLTVIGAGEAAVRTRFEGMTTDVSRNINLYGIDLDPATGATIDRFWGTIGVDQGPPTGAVKGRWRFRPPCLPFGSVVTDKQCVINQSGTFLPPTREVRAVIAGLEGQIPASPTAVTSANGLFFGQYHAPILEYIFPENIPGQPIVENNFNSIDFLACGGYKSSTGVLAGQLAPWPSSVVRVCANAPQPPIANAGIAQTVPSGALVTLAGSATGTAPITFSWTAPAGVTLSSPAIADPTFTAPNVATATVLTFTLTATNSLGSSSATTTVTVNAAGAPTVNHIPALAVGSGTPVTMTATGTDPGGLALTFQWTQTSLPALLTPNPFTGASVSFTSAQLTRPIGAPSVTYFFSVVATNSAGVSSAPEFTSLTVNPLADTVSITSAEYRTGKQRLIINATSSVVSPSVLLTLAPYLTTTGSTFDPSTLGNVFINNGGGLYILTLVGAPEPAVPPATPIIVKSSLGGQSLPTALTRIRP